MRLRVTVRKRNVTDRRTDRQGAFLYLPSRAFDAAGDKNHTYTLITSPGGHSSLFFLGDLRGHTFSCHIMGISRLCLQSQGVH